MAYGCSCCRDVFGYESASRASHNPGNVRDANDVISWNTVAMECGDVIVVVVTTPVADAGSVLLLL